MLNELRNRNKFIIRVVSIVLLALLALKTGGLLFSLFPGKYQVVASMTIDTEETENDEHKEIDKPCSKLLCLLTEYGHVFPVVEPDNRTCKNRDIILAIVEHYGIIPSPPPDQPFA